MALAGRCRTIIKNVPEVTAAAAAMHFRANGKQRAVFLGAHSVVLGLPETGPAGAAVEFGFRRIDRQIAAGAMELALAFLVIEGAGESTLGVFLAQNGILLRCEFYLLSTPLRSA